MRNITVIFVLFCCQLWAQNPNAKDILAKSISKCQAIQNGSYECSYYLKLYDGEEADVRKGRVVFEKNAQDGKLKALKQETAQNTLFVHDDIGTFKVSLLDSSYIFEDTNIWRDNDNLLFYPFLNPKKGFFNPEVLADTSLVFSYEREVSVEGRACHYIKYKFPDMEVQGFLFTDICYYFAIDKKTLLPLQLETTTSLLGKQQYTKLTIHKQQLNKKAHKKELAAFSPPSYCQDKRNLNNQTQKQPLSTADTLPAFPFRNMQGEQISWESIKQDYILVDFWYTSCFPCLLASDFIDSLSANFADKNLYVLGANPYDTDEQKVTDFKKKRGLSYPTVLIDAETANALPIIGYPTILIIERRSRKIVYFQQGYNPSNKAAILNFITQNISNRR